MEPHACLPFVKSCRAAKKKRRNQQPDPKEGKKGGQKSGGTAERAGQKSQGGPKPHESDHAGGVIKASSVADRPESHMTARSDHEEEGK